MSTEVTAEAGRKTPHLRCAAATRPAVGLAAATMLLFLPEVYGILSVGGSEVDVADFNALMEKCEEESEAFHELAEMVRQHQGTITVNAGRNQPGVFADQFTPGAAAWPLDLADLEKWPNPVRDTTGELRFPKGVPAWASTRCQILAHVLGERLAFADTGDPAYAPNHNAGIQWENRIRRDFDQQDDVEVSDPTDHSAPPPGSGHASEGHSGHVDAHSSIDGHQETWHIDVPALDLDSIEYHD